MAKNARSKPSSKSIISLTTQPSSYLAKSSTEQIPTTPSGTNPKEQACKPLPRASAISVTKTTTNKMPPNGSSTMSFMHIAKKWFVKASPMETSRNKMHTLKHAQCFLTVISAVLALTIVLTACDPGRGGGSPTATPN